MVGCRCMVFLFMRAVANPDNFDLIQLRLDHSHGDVPLSQTVLSSGEVQVQNKHSFTGRMCAATRAMESQRPDAIFVDPLGSVLAGTEARNSPMGPAILVPRTRYGDDFLVRKYQEGCHQLVLLGAGMDARAFRSFARTAMSSPVDHAISLSDLAVYEVDQQTTFDVKESLLRNEELTAASRTLISADLAQDDDWASKLLEKGFDSNKPSVWLIEGLLMYLSDARVEAIMRDIGKLSAVGSAVFHDGISKQVLAAGIAPAGAPFIGGSDEYAKLWRENAGYGTALVRDLRSIRVDRQTRSLIMDPNMPPNSSAEYCSGRGVTLFVEVEKA